MDYVTSVWLQRSELEDLLEGLDGLQQQGQRQYSKDFVRLDEAEQVQLLTQMESADSAASFWGLGAGHSKAFERLKELTVVGYYFSEVGTKQERRYVPMPGHYDGHYKLSEVGKQWSS